MLAPLARNAEEAVGSMGNDTPLAVLSQRKPLLYSYFKQLFAQVTNPPIDSIREAVVMSVAASVGSERNLLDETPEHARQLVIENPILLDDELERLRQVESDVFRSHTIDTTWPVAEAPTGSSARSTASAPRPTRALAAGANILILSDRAAGPERVPIPSLLATARGAPPSRARGHAPAGRASSSSRASRAASTRSPCSSATARPPSTRT